jgi:hypothetical protein
MANYCRAGIKSLRSTNLQTFGWCLQFKQSCPWTSLSYFCTQKTSREINAMGQVFLRKNVSENSALSILFEGGEGPCNLISLTLPPKNHNLFCEVGLKKGAGEKGKSVTTSPKCKSIIQGDGGCVKWDVGGGRTAAAPLHSLYMNQMICK